MTTADITQGSQLTEGERLEEWKTCVAEGKRVIRQMTGNQWKLGDLATMISENRHYGQHSLEQYADEIGIDAVSLRRYMMTAKAFKPDERRNTLSYSHHEALHNNPDRDEWLDKALANQWSIKDLITAVREAERTATIEDLDLQDQMDTPIGKPPEPVLLDNDIPDDFFGPDDDEEDIISDASPIAVFNPDTPHTVNDCQHVEDIGRLVNLLLEFLGQKPKDICEHVANDVSLMAEVNDLIIALGGLKGN